MDRCGAVLTPTAVQLALFEVDRVPAQAHEFGRPEPVPEGDQDHGLVAVTAAVAGAGRLTQPLHLGLGQVPAQLRRLLDHKSESVSARVA